jgi:hypothetical protein
MANYAQLMMATDAVGAPELSRERRDVRSRRIRESEPDRARVGNFGGHALRAVGEYLREHGATVGVFYLSNVEQYLRQDGIWGNFCANVASMPLTADSTFIRSQSGGGGGGGGFRNMIGPMQTETAACGVPAGVGVGR